MKKLIWIFQAALFYLFTLAFAIIPERFVNFAGGVIGSALPRLLVKRKRIALDNIRQALPFMKQNPAWCGQFETAEEIAAEMFRHLGISLVEVCRLYHGEGERVLRRIEVRGRENFELARTGTRGVLVSTGHCGNWELMALGLNWIFNENGSAVARQQNNPYLNKMVEKMRGRYLNKVIYKQGALRGIIGALKKNGLIGLLADQAVFPEEGALIDVMGRKAWASKAPVIIARKTGAILLPTFIHREKEKHIITIYPEHRLSDDASDEGIRRDTQELSRYLENFVCAHPADWYWVHRRWKRAGETSDAA
ncbi:MAG: lysophospholipid acyltransferase family protein [Deltaproteobacteria bacterium]|nr:lysophospholipid acyltransferase family protein [Deltaproteobacteria bacterium]